MRVNTAKNKTHQPLFSTTLPVHSCIVVHVDTTYCEEKGGCYSMGMQWLAVSKAESINIE